jgi:hypothetical protein
LRENKSFYVFHPNLLEGFNEKKIKTYSTYRVIYGVCGALAENYGTNSFIIN